jgi:glyoxylase-like metal-dependent hydrolase (beta-lactamase superfamily II)
VFLVTPDGVILGDPIGIAFARWLKTELAERFNSAVKYVIYSHHHPEHATGGIVFADTATFVAHENVVTALNASFPSNAGQMDRNDNGRIERSEAIDPGYPGNFDTYDRDGDDSITGIEINADTPQLDIVYSTQMSLELGGSRVMLMHPGPSHSDDMTVLLFPEERTVFGVDLLHVKRLPVSLNGYTVSEYVDANA